MPKRAKRLIKSVKIKPALLLSALLALSSVWTAAWARDLDQDQAQELRQAGVILPLEGFINQALERYPNASLLEVELEQKHGRYLYEIELLTSHKQARELKFDARTGELLVDKDDD